MLAFVFVLLIGTATYNQESDGTWLLSLAALAIATWFALAVSLPPWLKQGSYQTRFTFGAAYFTAVFEMFLVLFVGYTALISVLGSSRDIREHLGMLSLPLFWFSKKFLITPESSFPDLCGILLGNSFFYGLVLYVCYQAVHWSMRRSRTTQLSLGVKNPTDEDD